MPKHTMTREMLWGYLNNMLKLFKCMIKLLRLILHVLMLAIGKEIHWGYLRSMMRRFKHMIQPFKLILNMFRLILIKEML